MNTRMNNIPKDFPRGKKDTIYRWFLSSRCVGGWHLLWIGLFLPRKCWMEISRRKEERNWLQLRPRLRFRADRLCRIFYRIDRNGAKWGGIYPWKSNEEIYFLKYQTQWWCFGYIDLELNERRIRFQSDIPYPHCTLVEWYLDWQCREQWQ